MATKLTSIGERLRTARKSKGLTLRKLGEAVGLSHAFVGEVERGHRPLPPARREAFAKALDLAPADLTELDEATLEAVAQRLRAAGRCDRAVRLVREMAGGGA